MDEDGGSNWGRGYSAKHVLPLERGTGMTWEGWSDAPEQSEDENAKTFALFQIKTDCTDASLPKGNGVESANMDRWAQSNRASV
jgi:hypothetical protein